MIEYLHNAVRATAGEDITLVVRVTDAETANGLHVDFYNDKELLGTWGGILAGDVWEFTIPSTATTGLVGRYWYCICDDTHTKLNFKEPIYLL